MDLSWINEAIKFWVTPIPTSSPTPTNSSASFTTYCDYCGRTMVVTSIFVHSQNRMESLTVLCPGCGYSWKAHRLRTTP